MLLPLVPVVGSDRDACSVISCLLFSVHESGLVAISVYSSVKINISHVIWILPVYIGFLNSKAGRGYRVFTKGKYQSLRDLA